MISANTQGEYDLIPRLSSSLPPSLPHKGLATSYIKSVLLPIIEMRTSVYQAYL